MFKQLHYYLIEKSQPLCMRAKEFLLADNSLTGKISWCKSIQEIGGVEGCVLSNELLDNFSVHRVVMQRQLMEIQVDYQNGFCELIEPASEALNSYLRELKVVLPKGFCTEINLEATDWLNDVAASLARGYIMTIDYGYPSFEFYSAGRSKGTLMCYGKKGANTQPYFYIGEQDITSHVNFTALYHWGKYYNLDYCGFTDQAHFMMALGMNDYFKNLSAQSGNQYAAFMQELFLKRTLLGSMGSIFKVLIQKKGDCGDALLGLKH
jgi:SAM-dependent MidA family methyltransferase